MNFPNFKITNKASVDVSVPAIYQYLPNFSALHYLYVYLRPKSLALISKIVPISLEVLLSFRKYLSDLASGLQRKE